MCVYCVLVSGTALCMSESLSLREIRGPPSFHSFLSLHLQWVKYVFLAFMTFHFLLQESFTNVISFCCFANSKRLFRVVGENDSAEATHQLSIHASFRKSWCRLPYFSAFLDHMTVTVFLQRLPVSQSKKSVQATTLSASGRQ